MTYDTARPRVVLTFIAAFALALAGCPEEEPAPITAGPPQCVPGSINACACPGGGAGAQLCLSDGTYEPTCDCGGTDAGAETTPPADVEADVPEDAGVDVAVDGTAPDAAAELPAVDVIIDVTPDDGPADAVADGVADVVQTDSGIPDAEGDAVADAEPDAVADAEPDALPDAQPDALPDAEPDAVPDVTPDAVPDVTPDAVPDVTPDALPDAVADVVPDAVPDVVPDAVADALPDAVPDVAAETDAGSGCAAVITVTEGDEVIPQTKLHLSGAGSFAQGLITGYSWTVEAPDGTCAIFLPAASVEAPTFDATIVGTYTFRLTVTDEDNSGACTDAEYTVAVVPDDDIHLELLWDTPGDANQCDTGPEAGADLDIHFAHPFATGNDVDGDGSPEPWFHSFYDTFWFNGGPNWGSFDPLVDDDPALTRDDTDGTGPEIIQLNNPENGLTYRAAVHYWNDHSVGPSTATVRVYIAGALALELESPVLNSEALWEAVAIEWPSGTVTPQSKVFPNYPNPIFPNP